MSAPPPLPLRLPRLELEAERAATAALLGLLMLAVDAIMDADIHGLSRTLLQHPELVEYVHDNVKFAALNAHLNCRETLLHLACRQGFTLAVQLIVEQCRGDVNAQSGEPYLEQPLHLAAMCNTEVIVDVLLAHGAFSKAMNFEQMTAFMLACRHGSISTARKLLSLGLVDDIDAVDRSNRTALYYAAAGGLVEVVAQLWEAGAKLVYDCARRSPLHAACANGHVAAMQYLVKNGVRGDEPDARGVCAFDLLPDEASRHAARLALLEWRASGAETGRKLRQASASLQQAAAAPAAAAAAKTDFNWFQPLASPPFSEAAASPLALRLSLGFAAETPEETASRLLRERAAQQAAAVRAGLEAAAAARQAALDQDPPLTRMWPPKPVKAAPKQKPAGPTGIDEERDEARVRAYLL